jgi:hypothetical protein
MLTQWVLIYTNYKTRMELRELEREFNNDLFRIEQQIDRVLLRRIVSVLKK